MSPLEPLRAMSLGQRLGLAAVWVLTLAGACWITWETARRVYARTGHEAAATGGWIVRANPGPMTPFDVELPVVGTNAEPEPPPDPPVESKPARRPPRAKPEPEPPPVAVVERAAPEPERPALRERVLRVDALAVDDRRTAEREARALLAEFPSYTELTDALVDDGTQRAHADLFGLQLLHLAGHDAIGREVAREMLRSYAADEEIRSAIRRWKILRPHVASVQSSIENGRYVVVQGTVENPDVIALRRVRVRVVALDAGGNALGQVETRVRPKLLEPGSSGRFKAELKGLDPAAVLRTRTTVIEYESEVRDG